MRIKLKEVNIIFTVIFILCWLGVNGQQIQNVKAIQDGSKVLVTYDLSDQPGRPYYVRLLMSKDGGVTFGEELRYVTGDVRNTKAGTGKKIIWDASKEIAYFDGDAIFRVEAILKVAPMPEPIERKCAKIELTGIKAIGSRVVADIIMTSNSDGQFRIIFNNDYSWTSLFDPLGNEFRPVDGKMGDVQLGKFKTFVKGVPVKAQIIFENLSLDVTAVPMLKIRVESMGECGDDSYFQFRSIPLSR